MIQPDYCYYCYYCSYCTDTFIILISNTDSPAYLQLIANSVNKSSPYIQKRRILHGFSCVLRTRMYHQVHCCMFSIEGIYIRPHFFSIPKIFSWDYDVYNITNTALSTLTCAPLLMFTMLELTNNNTTTGLGITVVVRKCVEHLKTASAIHQDHPYPCSAYSRPSSMINSQHPIPPLTVTRNVLS